MEKTPKWQNWDWQVNAWWWVAGGLKWASCRCALTKRSKDQRPVSHAISWKFSISTPTSPSPWGNRSCSTGKGEASPSWGKAADCRIPHARDAPHEWMICTGVEWSSRASSVSAEGLRQILEDGIGYPDRGPCGAAFLWTFIAGKTSAHRSSFISVELLLPFVSSRLTDALLYWPDLWSPAVSNCLQKNAQWRGLDPNPIAQQEEFDGSYGSVLSWPT